MATLEFINKRKLELEGRRLGISSISILACVEAKDILVEMPWQNVQSVPYANCCGFGIPSGIYFHFIRPKQSVQRLSNADVNYNAPSHAPYSDKTSLKRKVMHM